MEISTSILCYQMAGRSSLEASLECLNHCETCDDRLIEFFSEFTPCEKVLNWLRAGGSPRSHFLGQGQIIARWEKQEVSLARHVGINNIKSSNMLTPTEWNRFWVLVSDATKRFSSRRQIHITPQFDSINEVSFKSSFGITSGLRWMLKKLSALTFDRKEISRVLGFAYYKLDTSPNVAHKTSSS